MSESKIYSDPGKASAEAGQVLLDGPDGIAISLTPYAAEETAKELLRAAAQARGRAHSDQLSCRSFLL